MDRQTEFNILAHQAGSLINEINDIYFNIAKLIYSINFGKAKVEFLNSGTKLNELITVSQKINETTNGKIVLDINQIGNLLNTIMTEFECEDYQAVADLLIYDFSDLINAYHDKL